MIFLVFDTIFSNQGVQMIIEETEIKNSKINALFYTKP